MGGLRSRSGSAPRDCRAPGRAEALLVDAWQRACGLGMQPACWEDAAGRQCFQSEHLLLPTLTF